MDALTSAERSPPTADLTWNEPSYDPLGRMHKFWLAVIFTGLIVLVGTLAMAARTLIFV
jgi:hypothetical protein